jgi:hypothetical protein
MRGRTGMQQFLKYDFGIQTRDGQKIDSIVISGRDQADAERKLFQMYRHCLVLRCEVKSAGKHAGHHPSVEDILTLISK